VWRNLFKFIFINLNNFIQFYLIKKIFILTLTNLEIINIINKMNDVHIILFTAHVRDFLIACDVCILALLYATVFS